MRTWPFRLSIIALGSAAIVAGSMGAWHLWRESRPGISELARIASLYRIAEGRLTGFPYRPLAPRMRGEASMPTASLQLLAVGAEITEAAQREPSIENLHGIGVAQLLAGNTMEATRDLADAVRQSTGEEELLAAIAKANDVALLNDVAVAYLQRGRVDHHLEDDLVAVSAADRAFHIAPTAEVAFNRALAIHAAHEPSQAAAAWNDYLKIDPSSKWASEARVHLQQLSPQIAIHIEPLPQRIEKAVSGGDMAGMAALVQHDASAAAVYVLEQVLPAWAAAQRDGNAPLAEGRLGVAELIGNVRASSGDLFVADAVRVVRTASSGDRIRLADGYTAYGEGRRLFRQDRIAEAAEKFSSSRDDLQGRSPAVILAWMYLGACQAYEGDYRGAESEMRKIVRRHGADAARYPSALGQVLWAYGVVQIDLGLPQEALASHQTALSYFERAKETENAAVCHGLVADDLEYIGDEEAAWRHRQAALRAARDLASSERLYPALSEAAEAALSAGYTASAELFQSRVVEYVKQIANPYLIPESLTWRCRIRNRHGDFVGARRDLEEARRSIAAIPDPRRRERSTAEVEGIAAEIFVNSDRELGEQKLSTLLGTLARQGNHFRVAEILLLRGRIRAEEGRIDAAGADFEQGIEELETIRAKLDDPFIRAEYFAKSQALFDEAIRCRLDRNDTASAFLLTERSRGRSLLDVATERGRSTATAEAIEASLPSGTALVEYAVVGERVVAWTLTRRGVTYHRLPIAAADCAREVRSLAATTDDIVYQQHTARLYDVLIRPLENELGGVTRLIIVPVRFLAKVPFPALYDRERGTYFIQRAELALVPSAALYLHALERAREIGAYPLSATIVYSAAAMGDRTQELPNVYAEAVQVAAIYPECVVARDNSRSKEALLELIGRTPIVHFAGHALNNVRYPHFSALSLPAAEHLYAYEIARQRFTNTRIVVLSACGTREHLVANEPGFGLPESFLAAGTPAVLMATQPVDDAAAASLTVKFHAALATTADPARALRKTQMSLIGKIPPSAWGVWQLIGI